METTAERTAAPAAAQDPPRRRVGTFTLGLTLLAGGGVMLASTFFPDLDLTWALRLGPLILICLGVETLLAVPKNGRIKYDWAGILLSFLLACGGLGLFAASWGITHWMAYGSYYEGARMGNESALVLDYRMFNTTQWQDLELKAGDVLEGRVVSSEGRVGAYIMDDGTGDLLFEDDDLATGVFTVEIPRDGTYEVSVTGHQAVGSFRLKKAAAPEDPETDPAPEDPEGPEDTSSY